MYLHSRKSGHNLPLHFVFTRYQGARALSTPWGPPSVTEFNTGNTVESLLTSKVRKYFERMFNLKIVFLYN